MKTRSTFHSFLAIISLALAASAPLAFGQSKPPPPGGMVTMDVDFKDATIAEIVEFLAKKDEGLNVVVQQTVKAIQVSLKLRNVTSQQVLNALPFATEGGVDIETLPDSMVGVKAAMSPQNIGSDGLPIRPECRIFSLAAYLAGKDEKVRDIAIEQFHRSLDSAVQMLNDASPQTRVKTPQLQVNPETKLLIAVGLPDDLAVVEQLVTALQGNASAPVYGYRKDAPRAPMGLPGLPGGLSPQPPAAPPVGIPGIAPGQEVPNSTPKAPGASNALQPVPTVPATRAR